MKKINKVNYEKFMGINSICDDMKKNEINKCLNIVWTPFAIGRNQLSGNFQEKKIRSGGEVVLPVGI